MALANRGDGGQHAGLMLPAVLFGAAGGGSSNFGGGGGSSSGGGSFSGGGGGGSFSSGSGGSIADMPPIFWALVALALFLYFVVGPLVSRGERYLHRALLKRMAAWRHARAAARRSQHLGRADLAAAEAVADDAAFDADAIRAKAAALFVDVQKAWDADDRARLAELVGPDLMTEWARRLDDFSARGWRNRVTVLEGPEVELVRIANAAADADDRAVVHVSAQVRDIVKFNLQTITRTDSPEVVDVDEYWHLRRDGDRWRLESIEQEAEGAYNLTTESIATPWGDSTRLHDQAVAELAGAAPEGVAPAELADLDFAGPARAKALDLALADGRFDPDLIEASVRRAVAAWAEAVDGSDVPLQAVAPDAVIGELLYPGDLARTTRLVVRGQRILAVRITALDPAATPPTITVEVDVRGRRYLEHRDTQAVVAGSRDRESSFTERWTLALEGSGDWPWRIALVA
jgi:predicted lipid-binding transport protein (Tim44 family)